MVTVTGTVWDLHGRRANIYLDFRYRSSPAIITAGAIYSGISPRVTTNTSGFFTVVLPMGDYNMVIGGVDTFIISVPDETNTYDFAQLIVGEVTQTPTTPAGSFEPDATLTVKGIVTLQTIIDLVAAATASATAVADATALRAVASTSAPGTVRFFLSQAEYIHGAVDAKAVIWDAASVAADDPPNVYKPNDIDLINPGRWVFYF